MITGINTSKILIKHIHVTVDVNLIVGNTIQSKNWITIIINAVVNKKQNITNTKKIILRIVAYALVNVIDILRFMNI